MYKVLIVDDEIFVRQGLKIMIDWAGHGMEIIGEADNGKQAIRKINALKPDIVITDMKMPEMNGVELIQKMVQKYGDMIKFIVISGYADFDYAQKAMQYSVKKYLLKPVDESELLNALLALQLEIQEKINNTYNQQLKQRMKIEEVIHRILEQKTSIIYSPESFNIHRAEKYILIVMNISEPIYYGRNKEVEENIRDKNNQYIYEIECSLNKLVNRYKCTDVFKYENSMIGLLVDCRYTELRGKSIGSIIGNLKNDLVKKGIHCKIYVTDIFRNFPNDFSEVLLQLKKLIKIGFYSDKLDIVEFNQYKSILLKDEFDNKIFTNDILLSIDNAYKDKAKKQINQTFVQIRNEYIDPDVIKINLNNLVYHVMEIISEANGNYKCNFKNHLIYNFDYKKIHVGELESLMQIFCQNSIEYICELRKNLKGGKAYQVKKYIDAHFMDDINMKLVALEFDMNPVYLGTLFSKEYHIKFNEYLHRLRITEAKRLLKQTSHKAFEISEQVGYLNPQYFSKKFIEYENMTPSEYRKKYETIVS